MDVYHDFISCFNRSYFKGIYYRAVYNRTGIIMNEYDELKEFVDRYYDYSTECILKEAMSLYNNIDDILEYIGIMLPGLVKSYRLNKIGV